MKKILFLGACVASLAIASSSAFAAVTYGQDDTLTITNPAANSTDPVTSISVDASNFGTTGQMTVLVLDGTDSTNITADKILYIDQDDAGTNIFQDMGLKLPEGETKLADGSYKIMVGNDQGAALLSAVMTISAGTVEDKNTVAYGNVNGDLTAEGAQNITGMDASLVLQYTADLISGFKDQKGNTIPVAVANVNGDLTAEGEQNITGMDASLILQYTADLITGFKDQNGNPLTTLEY